MVNLRWRNDSWSGAGSAHGGADVPGVERDRRSGAQVRCNCGETAREFLDQVMAHILVHEGVQAVAPYEIPPTPEENERPHRTTGEKAPEPTPRRPLHARAPLRERD